MTATETRVEAVAGQPGDFTAAVSDPGIGGWFSTTDHKRLGRLLIGTSVLTGILGLVLRLIVTIEATDASGYVILDADNYRQMFAISMDSILYLLLMPFFIGIAFVVVPLQVGARSIAYPRAAAGAVWGMVLSGSLLVGSYIINGGPFGGDASGVDLYLISLAVFVVSVMGGALCIASTVVGLRAPGMSLTRVPSFAWSAFVTSVAMILSLSVLAGLLALLYIDHRYGRLIFGGNEGILGHVSWLFHHPQTYLMAIPALGVLAEIVSVSSGQRDKSMGLTHGAIAMFAILSFGAWAQTAVVGPVRNIWDEPLFVVMALLAVIPVKAVVLKALLTFRSGELNSPLATLGFALVGGILLILGTGTAAIAAVIDAIFAGDNFRLESTTFAQGETALVFLGGGLMGLYAATYHWAPKIWGRSLSSGLGLFHLAATATGVTLVAVGFMVSGAIWDQPSGAPLYDAAGQSELMSGVAAVGYGLVAAGAVLFLVNLLSSILARSSDKAVADPWSGHTLEWSTESPPEPGNFAAEMPLVTSGAPLLDAREANAESGEAS